jgi:DNA-directed RNA polymerase subunit beta'
MPDCGTTVGIDITALKGGDEIIESLGSRVIGRTLLYDLYHPVNNELIANADEIITEEIARKIDELNIDMIEIRSVLTCEADYGVCGKCYGRNLATSRHVDIGEAVGIIAAQSIGQPGTQLTMRTFHIGGIATGSVEESDVRFDYPVYFKDMTARTIVTDEGKTMTVRRGYIVVQRVTAEFELQKADKLLVTDGTKVYPGSQILQRAGETVTTRNSGFVKIMDGKILILGDDHSKPINVGAEIFAEEGNFYERGFILATFDNLLEQIVTEHDGTVEYVDIELNKSMIEDIDMLTGVSKRVIVEYKTEKLQPRFNVLGKNGVSTTYLLPKNSYLMVKDGDKVSAGTVLAKIPKQAEKTKDITGGLPRVAELFEARVPKDKCTLAEIDGQIVIGDTVKNKRKITIEGEDGVVREYSIPSSKFLRVQDGDFLHKGEKVDDGPIDPHDILSIKGPRELQKFLVNEIQEVYRVQGVAINDKHIEVIVRQMMRKVRISDPGDTNFVIEQIVDKFDFKRENERVVEEGGSPAEAEPVLMGITKAALNTESFISAASFQETTRVLTDAAIKGKVDNLRGLKENVIIGHIIPAGTGMPEYREYDVYQDEIGDLAREVEAAERRRREYEIENAAAAPTEAEADAEMEEDSLV